MSCNVLFRMLWSLDLVQLWSGRSRTRLFPWRSPGAEGLDSTRTARRAAEAVDRLAEESQAREKERKSKTFTFLKELWTYETYHEIYHEIS